MTKSPSASAAPGRCSPANKPASAQISSAYRKALTGGYLPLAACLTTNEVYQAFYDDYSTLRAFLHSHSYTGNPLACAAALATLDIFEQDNVIEANKALAARMASATAHLADHPHVAEVRQTGMALAIEMVQDKASKTAYPWQERRGLKVFQHALERGALLRPLGSGGVFLTALRDHPGADRLSRRSGH